MQIQVITKNLKEEGDIKEYAEKKLNKLTRYLNNITSVKLELIEEKSKSRLHQYSAQVTLNVNGFIIRGEQKGDDTHATVDAVADVMERLVNKYKARYEVNKGREQASIRKPADSEMLKSTEVEPWEVVKLKKFKVKPMTANEAIEQMEFIGHDFFIFISNDDQSVNVVYKRKDGKYGVLQPESA
ncbi:MAG: ribosome-associated translation inhibitor RaiA [Dehalococcoidia bacterium]|nr:ribosome-associated translation inhibitor RaiA [Dehalococcoidia bacterium]